MLDLIRAHAATVAAINAGSGSAATCVWAPPRPAGDGCASLTPALELGAMPWACMPGEPQNVNSCAPPGNAAALFRDPPGAWRGAARGADLPYNAIEALVMGKLLNNGSVPINLRGAWLIVPFSRGVQTKYEGEWLRVTQPNAEFTRYCWCALPAHCALQCSAAMHSSAADSIHASSFFLGLRRSTSPTAASCSRTRATCAPAAR